MESNCSRWADEGSCYENPQYMLAECRAECAAYVPGTDATHDCDKWAGLDGECSKNVGFMQTHCAPECGRQWLWNPQVRAQLGLAAQPPKAVGRLREQPERAPPARLSGDAVVVDGLYALRVQTNRLKQLVLRGELPDGVNTLPEQAGPLVESVVGNVVLYAARLGALLARQARALRVEVESAGLIASSHAALQLDAARVDWALRSLPQWVGQLESVTRSLERLSEEADLGLSSGGERSELVSQEVREARGEHASSFTKWTTTQPISHWRYLKASAALAGQESPRGAATADDVAKGLVPLKYAHRGHKGKKAVLKLPLLGVGTCWLSEGESRAAVMAALAFLDSHPDQRVHVDSAEAYRNEAAIGTALQARSTSKDARSRVFLATKLSDERHLSYDGAKRRVLEALRDLQVPQIDLFSLHSPFGFTTSPRSRFNVAEAWRGLVELKLLGKIGALGVSNFNANELREFASDVNLGKVAMPDVVQNKLDPYRQGDQQPWSVSAEDDALVAAKELGLVVVGYSALSGWPLGFGALGDPLLAQVAARYHARPAQLLTRWLLDSGHAAIPRSSNPSHVAEHLDALRALQKPLTSAEKDLISSLAHFVAHHRNKPRARDAFGVSALEAAPRDDL